MSDFSDSVHQFMVLGFSAETIQGNLTQKTKWRTLLYIKATWMMGKGECNCSSRQARVLNLWIWITLKNNVFRFLLSNLKFLNVFFFSPGNLSSTVSSWSRLSEMGVSNNFWVKFESTLIFLTWQSRLFLSSQQVPVFGGKFAIVKLNITSSPHAILLSNFKFQNW